MKLNMSIARGAAPHFVVCGKRRTALRRSRGVNVVAFRESDKTVTDWRVQKMIAVSRQYYDDICSKGNWAVASNVLADQVVFKDMAAIPMNVVVGRSALQREIKNVREMYPDLWYDVEQIGFCDSNHLFVQWNAEATNLGNNKGQKATHHHSKWSGVDLVGFNDERDKITEVTVYRQLTNEERVELQGMARTHDVVSFEDRYELRLSRLHWDPTELRVAE